MNCPGETETDTRQAVRADAKATVERSEASGTLTGAIAEFTAAIATDARTANAQVLVESGISEDAALEIALSAAVGLGQARLEHGLRALEEADR